MSVALRNNVDDQLEVFHGTSVRKTHVVMTGNVLLLNCYYPTREFDSPKMNGPICQFTYGRGKRSPFLNQSDVRMLIEALVSLNDHITRGHEHTEMGHRLSFGEIKVSDKHLWFINNGERYRNNHRTPGVFVENIISALKAFLQEKGEEFPFSSTSKYEHGVTTDTMFLLTHHGDTSYGQIPSYLRYIHSTDGKGGELTLQFGQLQLHLNEGHTRGVSWKHFLAELSKGLDNVAKAIEDGSKGHTERLYSDHVVLGKYNCYVSMIKEYRGTFVVISTDLSCTNSKVSFVVEGDNLSQLKTFIKAVVIYLEKK